MTTQTQCLDSDLRDLAMVQFNRSWTMRLARLRPMAGYLLDAKHFRAELVELQQTPGIADDDL